MQPRSSVSNYSRSDDNLIPTSLGAILWMLYWIIQSLALEYLIFRHICVSDESTLSDISVFDNVARMQNLASESQLSHVVPHQFRYIVLSKFSVRRTKTICTTKRAFSSYIIILFCDRIIDRAGSPTFKSKMPDRIGKKRAQITMCCFVSHHQCTEWIQNVTAKINNFDVRIYLRNC